MKVALATPYDLSTPGGVNSHVFSLAHELDRRGIGVKILGPTSGRTIPQWDRVISIGRALPIRSAGSVARIAVNPFDAREVRRILAKERFDVLHLHEPLVPMVPFASLVYTRTATVGTFHLHRERPNPFYFGLSPFLRRLCRKLDGRIAVSPAAERTVSRFIPGDYIVIPNGIDYGRFHPPKLPRDSKSVLFVGRLERRKGLEELIVAFSRVEREVPGARLVVAGEGPERRRAERLAEREGLRDVQFLGYVDDERLPGLYNEAAIFCAPSIRNESFGIVLIEAMAGGAPVIASDIDGYREVVRDGETGILVPPRDTDALAAQIIRVLRDEDLRTALSERAALHAALYSWENVAERILGVYETAAARARARAALPRWLHSETNP